MITSACCCGTTSRVGRRVTANNSTPLVKSKAHRPKDFRPLNLRAAMTPGESLHILGLVRSIIEITTGDPRLRTDTDIIVMCDVLLWSIWES